MNENDCFLRGTEKEPEANRRCVHDCARCGWDKTELSRRRGQELEHLPDGTWGFVTRKNFDTSGLLTRKVRAKLRDARVKKGMRQRDIAGMIGISERAYSFYETGRTNQTEEIALKICEILGKSRKELEI